MRSPLREFLATDRTLIGDGAMGTELQKAGLEPGGCGDEWNLLYPERVLAIQRAYAQAGSQCLITNTFGSNAFVLARYDLQDRIEEIAQDAARIARDAIGEEGYVLGDVGPCGGFLQPLGDVTEDALSRSLRRQIGALLSGGVDAIIFETMTALDELELGIRIARELAAPCIIASLAFDKLKGGGYKTMMGVAPQDAARAAMAAGADVLGANCGTRLEPIEFVEIARLYREVSSLPVMLQPNAGTPRLEGANIVYPVSPEEIAPTLLELARHAAIVGGCCGSGPAHIQAFAQILAQDR